MSITLVVGKRTADHEFGEILNGQMIVTGRALFSVIALELREGHESALPDYLDEFVRLRRGHGDWFGKNKEVEVYDNDFYFQLVDPSGTTVFASQHPPLFQPEESPRGLFAIGAGDSKWHLFGLQDTQTGYTFYTGQSEVLRRELSRESIEYILLPFVLVTIFILAAIWVGTRYGLRPLIQLTQQLDKRTPDMLDTIDIEGKATELRPLVVALNRLFERVSKGLATERQFSADASHELRTPLAGIKANLDAARILSKVPEQQKYLDNIESSVDNATSVTAGLLLLSRLQSTDLDAYFNSNRFNVTCTTRSEVDKRNVLDLSSKERIKLTVVTDEQTLFYGSESLAEIAIGNILENALKYSSEQVDVEVSADSRKNIFVKISDYGPGIPKESMDQVFRRFYRANTDSTKGFGLGLALVQQTMSALGGTIELRNRTPHGLTAKLKFPACVSSLKH